MPDNTRVTIAGGDGIGPEIMDATLKILDAAGARLEYDEVKIGIDVYKQGHNSGIAPETWDIIRRNPVFLKAPITTPQGGGYKSLNVTIRKSLGLFANVRPCKTYTPYVESHFHNMDMVIIRENEEDLYAGIEHQQTHEVAQCLKLISRPGCEKIIRYAFEYARHYGREKVTCMTKDNIMKQTDGLFSKVFDEIAIEYPDIETDHRIIDIGSAFVAHRPEELDVVVTLNLYGDIISDIAAQIAGSVGMSGSANVGMKHSMFEAIHGSAPGIAGKKIANPSGLLQAAIMMLVHLGRTNKALTIENAWMKTLEDGYHTADIYRTDTSKKLTSTDEFAEALIERLGEKPKSKYLSVHKYEKMGKIKIKITPVKKKKKELVGCDVFIDWDKKDRDPEVIGSKLEAMQLSNMKLKMITNRGVKVYPGGLPETFASDHWRCRFTAKEEGKALSHDDILELLKSCREAGFDFIKTEHLYTFDGERAYSLGQGE
ncbi:MAG: NADP-dependent isocitrate dehydrogenase [Bacteroidota bacterium]